MACLVALLAGCGEGTSSTVDAARADRAPADDAAPCVGAECDWLEPLDLDASGDFDGDLDAGDPDADPADASVTDAAASDTGLDASAGDATRTDAAPTDAPRDSGAAPLPTPTCANVNQRLRDDFGIVIRPGTLAFEGLATEDIGCADRIKVYEMFRLPFQYARYVTRINPADDFTLHLYRSARPATGSCSAYVPNSQAIQIRDLSQCLRVVSGPADADFIRIAMFLIHESGHIITARNPSLRTAFQAANLAAADPRCYDRGFLKTYSLRSTNPVSESFAEATALFIGRRKVGPLGTISDFAAECPNTHAWIRTNVFGMRL